ncbi:MAG: AAA family ATPase [Gammaproteobacteria bacterium]|nr:AAA family ATPase [Gammaproteobacteria bacterium]
MATLFIFAGLPGTGKTTLSERLARRVSAVHLRIDTVEQALRDLCHLEVEGEGYRLSYRIASDNLRMGMDVVADSCNPLELTRREWEQVAEDTGSHFINIEVVCSDGREHRRRIESRTSDISGLKLPLWRDIEDREYHSWSKDRIIIDTAGRSAADSIDALMLALGISHETP